MLITNIPGISSCLRAAVFGALVVAAPVGAADSPANGAGGIQPAAIYQKTCSACHGEKGDGRSFARTALSVPPRDFTADEARRDLTRPYMITIVRDGRPHKPMVGRSSQLSQAQIEAVVDFIRAAFMPPEPGTPLARGRDLYRSTCASCHGDRGKGGAAQAGIPAAPSLSLASAGPSLTRERIVTGIAREKHGAAKVDFATKLTPTDMQAIADYIRSAFIDISRVP